MSVHVNVCVCEALTRTCHISYTLSSLFSLCLPVCCTPSPLNTPLPCAHSQQPPLTHTPRNPPPPICMVCVSRAVAMPTAHFLCLSCRRIWSESTLPPTGYCRQLQALKHQFPHQSPKGFGQKKHWHRNVAVVVLPSATINIAFFFLFFLEI